MNNGHPLRALLCALFRVNTVFIFSRVSNKIVFVGGNLWFWKTHTPVNVTYTRILNINAYEIGTKLFVDVLKSLYTAQYTTILHFIYRVKNIINIFLCVLLVCMRILCVTRWRDLISHYLCKKKIDIIVWRVNTYKCFFFLYCTRIKLVRFEICFYCREPTKKSFFFYYQYFF